MGGSKKSREEIPPNPPPSKISSVQIFLPEKFPSPRCSLLQIFLPLSFLPQNLISTQFFFLSLTFFLTQMRRTTEILPPEQAPSPPNEEKCFSFFLTLKNISWWGTSSVVERSLIMREVPSSIPGPVKCPLPEPGYWKIVGVTPGRQPAISTQLWVTGPSDET